MAYEPHMSDAARAYRERMCGGAGFALAAADPELIERFSSFALGEAVGETDLPDRTRLMCWVATCLGSQAADESRVMVGAAPNMGVEPEAVREMASQGVACPGVARVFPFLRVLNEVFVTRGAHLPSPPLATTEPADVSTAA